MIKVVAVSHAYTEPFCRVGLINRKDSSDISTVVVVPSRVIKKDKEGFKKLENEGFTIKKCPSLFNFHHSVRFYLPKLFFLLILEKPDIIFINNEPWSMTAFQIVIFCRLFLRNTKIIIYTCENIARKYIFPFSIMEKYVLRSINQIATITVKEGNEVLKKKYYFGSTIYIPLAVDTTNFKKLKDTSIDADRLLPKDKIIIGFVGRIVKEKGIQTLIDALNLLGNNFHALIVGDGPYKNELLNHAKLKNVFNNITFAGSINYDDLPIYYNRMNVFVLPSLTTYNWKEQFGRVLIEAMACEVPVVGSSSGEIRNVIGDGGVIFEENNPSSLAYAILKILDNSNEYSLLGRKRVENNFSSGVIDLITLDNYKNMISNNH